MVKFTRIMTTTIAAAAATIAATVMVVPAAQASMRDGTTEQVGSATAADVNRLAEAGIDAQQLRPGWHLEGNEIVWDNGAVMASITSMSADDCQATYLCFWQDSNFNGRRLQFHDDGLRGDMRDYSFNDAMSSWRNRNAHDARWYYDTNGRGTSRCIEDGTRNSNLGSDNDKMSSFRIYSNNTSC